MKKKQVAKHKPFRYEAALKNIYLSPENPAGYSHPYKLWQAANKINSKITLDMVKTWLETRDSYTLYRKANQHFRRRKVIVSGVGIQFQADLLDFAPIKKENRGNRYLMTTIDCFSRKATAIPMKKKDEASSLKALKKTFQQMGKPKKLQTDKGSEFINKKVKKYLKDNKIHLFHSSTKIKASIVERFNRTLRTKIIKYIAENKTLTYINILDDLLKSYNNSIHSTLEKYTPNQVSKKNEDEIFEIQYRDYLNERSKKFKFKIGDIVRLAVPSVLHKTKAHHRNFTTELYTVVDVLKSTPPTYRVKDMKNQILQPSIYYEHQMQKSRPESVTISNLLTTHPLFGGL